MQLYNKAFVIFFNHLYSSVNVTYFILSSQILGSFLLWSKWLVHVSANMFFLCFTVPKYFEIFVLPHLWDNYMI